MTTEEACIIKVLKPVAKRKIKREIKILRNLTGGPNIVGLLDVVHDPPSRSNSLIMEFVDNSEWKELFPSFSELEIRHYVFQLLTVRRPRSSCRQTSLIPRRHPHKALDFVHSRGIMHRDVKPGNVMYDRRQRKVGAATLSQARRRALTAPQLVTTDRLGSCGILPSGHRIPHTCRFALLQGTRAPSG